MFLQNQHTSTIWDLKFVIYFYYLYFPSPSYDLGVQRYSLIEDNLELITLSSVNNFELKSRPIQLNVILKGSSSFAFIT